MTEQELVKLFMKTNALLKGHFELSSGKHSDTYFQCALLLQYPEYTECAAKELAQYYAKEQVTCVIGPALGGVTIAYELGRQLGCRALFTERKDGLMQLRRGFSVSSGDRVVLVEDVITTGGSILEVAELVQSLNVTVVGMCSIVNRSAPDARFPYPLKSLMRLTPVLYEPAVCPLCAAQVPITKPGSKTLTAR